MPDTTIQSVAKLTKLYIDGNYVEPKSGQKYTLYNPSDGSVVSSEIPVAGQEDVDAAVTAAEKAFHGPWSKFTGAQRSACLRKLAELLDEKDTLLDLLTLDTLSTGNPVSLIPTREKNYIMSQLLYYAGWTDKLRGDYLPDDDGFVKLVRHEPLGVCAGINPFNAPVATLIMKIAPCLATGNTIIIKPSEYSPLGSLAIGPLFEAAGFPKGVFQVVTGAGDTGALLAAHMRIRKISFTGSVATGKKIQIAATQSNLKRVTLELGGKSPAVVFEDANLDNALTWTINAILARSGQVCVAASRVYVQRSIADKFIEGYKERMKAAAENIGNPLDTTTSLGPLVGKAAFERVSKMIERGKTEAELVVGGVRHGEQGCYIEPTVFLNPKKDAQVYKEEIFGPVSVIKTFETEEEVLEMANDTEFGLMSGVFTKDINRALRFSSRLESGVVGVNCVSYMNVQAPFGGKKSSGIGREFGEYALRGFTEPKTVLINLTYGYCFSVTSTTLGQPSFFEYFNLSQDTEAPQYAYTNRVIGGLNGCFSGGGLLGALVGGWACDALGRKKTLLLASPIAILGGALHGFAVGILMVIIPLFQCEIAPPAARGFLVSQHGIVIVFGYATAAWIGFVIVAISLVAFDTGSPRVSSLASLLMDRVGRVKLLTIGISGCLVSLIFEAALSARYIGTENSSGLSAGVFFLFLFISFYGCCIDATTYVYCTEIFPTHIRSRGMAWSLAILFATTIAYLIPAPTAFAQVGWKYYLLFIILTVINIPIIWTFFPETKGLALEEVGEKFGDDVLVRPTNITTEQREQLHKAIKAEKSASESTPMENMSA
ncbi:hypothetical protein PISL3812_05884 [Talaromyces islandicus]|uniref:aldehyde dehydrogenase (NAD(+)) n=1 Tax=Talaromyces islandicus TaxID=28573 RepID=A0A0U1LZZ1_TALIS|nr:hypothetical protein PISL3812_05884 [Talaromyces islandicus]